MPTFNPMTGAMTPTAQELGRAGQYGLGGQAALQGMQNMPLMNQVGMTAQQNPNAAQAQQQMMNAIASQGLMGALGHGPALGFLLRGGSLGGLSSGNPYGSIGGTSLPYTTQQFGTPQAGGTNLLQPGKIQS